VGEDRPQTSRQRVTVAQAAEILGVTVEAIRGRIKRGTLEHERHSGTVYVLLDADQSTNRTRPDNDQTTDRVQSDSAALISAKDETIATLREQIEDLRRERDEWKEQARMVLSAAMERFPPQREAPPEARESPETVEEEQGRGRQPQPATGGVQEGVQRRSWWRRLLNK
jgi:hypothetical protein